MRWGFVPAGAPVERAVINARAESAPTRGAFREAFARRRCLVPADGFYEWQAVGGERKKRPHHVRPAQGGLLAIAGLWQPAPDDHGALTLLTTEPNLEMRGIHDRMPVIVARAAFAAWLDPQARVDALVALMQPPADGTLRATPVGFAVNDVRAEGPACLLPPVEEPPRQGRLPWGEALE
jgi:putative SOS response-associated peptidase YedK